MNNAFHEQFPGPHVILPVIHVVTEAQAVRNTLLAREAGSDGVFLINHAVSAAELLEIHAAVAHSFPVENLDADLTKRLIQNVRSYVAPAS